MANVGYYRQLLNIRIWRMYSEDTLKNDLMNLYGYRLPQIRSRNLKIRLIQTLLECKDGVCYLNYDELKEVVEEGKYIPSTAPTAKSLAV